MVYSISTYIFAICRFHFVVFKENLSIFLFKGGRKCHKVKVRL